MSSHMNLKFDEDDLKVEKEVCLHLRALCFLIVIFLSLGLLHLFFSDYYNLQIFDNFITYKHGVELTYKFDPPSILYEDAIQHTKQKNAFFVGISHNNEKTLPLSLALIDHLGKFFKSYKVSLYENDSTDKSAKIIWDWVKSHPNQHHLYIQTEDTLARSAISTGGLSIERFQRMATVRNRYLDVYEKFGGDSDYLIMLDMDVFDLKLDGFLSSFTPEALKKNWSAVGCNGVFHGGLYYDTLAFRDKTFPDTRIREQRTNAHIHYPKGSPWKQVDSMFGGIVVYKSNCFGNCKYNVNTDDCEHVEIYKCMKKKNPKCNRFFINPDFLLDYQNFSLP